MAISLTKLLLLVAVFLAVWTVVRWLNGPPARALHRRRPHAQPQRRIEAEDLVPCSVCGAYVATTARRCGRTNCPLPR